MMCLSMMLCSWAVTACGNKGDLFLPADAQVTQELDSVSERLGEGAIVNDGIQTPLPAEVDLPGDTTTTITDEVDDADEATPAKKKP